MLHVYRIYELIPDSAFGVKSKTQSNSIAIFGPRSGSCEICCTIQRECDRASARRWRIWLSAPLCAVGSLRVTLRLMPLANAALMEVDAKTCSVIDMADTPSARQMLSVWNPHRLFCPFCSCFLGAGRRFLVRTNSPNLCATICAVTLTRL